MVVKFCDERNIGNNVEDIDEQLFEHTRPKPAFGRQGLDSDRWARIQFSQVHFGAKTSRNQQGDPTDLLWCKNVTSPTGGSNRPFRCLDEGREGPAQIFGTFLGCFQKKFWI